MRVHATAICLLAGLAACGRGGAGSDRPPGAESFVAQAPRIGGRGGVAVGGEPAAAGPAATPDTADGGAATRTVQESDLYQLAPDGKTLYVLNGFRGLLIVDLQDLDRPRLLARVPAVGAPRDLYARGSVVYFTVSDTIAWAWAAGDTSVEPKGGSQVWTVDVRDPAAPAVLSRLDVEGSIVDTRVVGDVLYVFSRRYGWWDLVTAGGGIGVAASGGASSNLFHLASFDLREPRAPVPVDRRSFDASGWDAHAHFTADRVTVAQASWDAGRAGELTLFSAFDVRDPSGRIVDGARFQAPGHVVDRWSMDFEAATGLFRSVLAEGWNGGAAVRVWSSPQAGAAEPLGAAVVGAGETLTAARFDGHRAYVVTARAVDPLFAVDTSDPSRLVVGMAPLHMPGQLDFIEPRGDRLVALGRTNESGAWQLAASLFDVRDLDRPALQARALFGDGAQWVNASRDDMRKAFQVLDGAGLVVVPFQGWDPLTYRWNGGVQILSLDLAGGQLARRGSLAHRGDVSRAFLLPQGTRQLCALSDQRLQIVDASALDAPRERGGLDLARPVADLAFAGGNAIELAGDRWRGDTELVVTEAGDPDAPAPLARFSIPAPQARMFLVGSTAWLLAADWRDGAYRSWLQGVDLADPLRPRAAGRLDVSPGTGAGVVGALSWGYGDEAVVLGSTLALHRQVWRTEVFPADAGASVSDVPPDAVLLFDLSDPDAPRAAGEVALPASGWSWGLAASGGSLWITHFTPSDAGTEQGRFFLDRIDVGAAGGPTVTSVNVPGVFVASTPGGQRVYTLETVWPAPAASGAAPAPRSYLHALDLTSKGTARLAASLPVDGAPSGAAIAADRIYLAMATWSATETSTDLVAVDLGRLRAASRQSVAAWVTPLRATGGKLFLYGWFGGASTVLVFDLTDPDQPTFERSTPAPSWPATVEVNGAFAYLPSGPYGVVVVPLAR